MVRLRREYQRVYCQKNYSMNTVVRKKGKTGKEWLQEVDWVWEDWRKEIRNDINIGKLWRILELIK